MDTYIGVKVIFARPMTRLEYNQYRGWELPANENGEDDGMLVEYIDGGKPNHPDHEGYISWSPMDVFYDAYRKIDYMTFGLAIEALKKGYRVTRAGWNGKGMWLVLVNGTNNLTTSPGSPYHEAGVKECDILPHIDMWTVNAEGRRAMLCGWTASQTDMLAEDWMII